MYRGRGELFCQGDDLIPLFFGAWRIIQPPDSKTKWHKVTSCLVTNYLIFRAISSLYELNVGATKKVSMISHKNIINKILYVFQLRPSLISYKRRVAQIFFFSFTGTGNKTLRGESIVLIRKQKRKRSAMILSLKIFHID